MTVKLEKFFPSTIFCQKQTVVYLVINQKKRLSQKLNVIPNTDRESH